MPIDQRLRTSRNFNHETTINLHLELIPCPCVAMHSPSKKPGNIKNSAFNKVELQSGLVPIDTD